MQLPAGAKPLFFDFNQAYLPPPTGTLQGFELSDGRRYFAEIFFGNRAFLGYRLHQTPLCPEEYRIDVYKPAAPNAYYFEKFSENDRCGYRLIEGAYRFAPTGDRSLISIALPVSGELVDTWEYETCGQATGWVTGADGVRRKTVAHAGSVFYLEDFKNNITVRGEWKSFSKCLACRAVAEKALQDALTRARSKNGGRLNETTKVVPAIEKEYGPAGSVFYTEMRLEALLRNLAETYNSLLENVKVPPSVWQPGGKSYVRDETAVLSGALDQGLEELSEIPAMVGLGLAFVSDPDGAFEQLKTFAQQMDWQKAQSLAVEVARGAVFADEFEKGGKYALHATGRVGVVLAKAAATGGLLAVIKEAPNTLKKRLDDIVALLGKLKSRLENPSAELLARLETDLANKEFFDALRDKNELVDGWKAVSELAGERAWVKKSIPLLEKMSGKSDDFMAKVKQYYSTHQKPSGSGVPPFTHQGTPFDDFGHPNFVPEVPNMSGGHGKIKYKPEDIPNQPALNGTGTDMNRANTWAKAEFNKNGLNFKEHPTVSGRFYVKDPIHQYADADGWVECVWHHHEDAKTMFPVPIQTHNRSFPTGSPHTGGASILTKPELQDLIGFFNSPIGI